ncbi:MAG TPA: hypothetical protein VGL77_04815 [Armatimonadota bacterium]|jgi:hypothetical protein
MQRKSLLLPVLIAISLMFGVTAGAQSNFSALPVLSNLAFGWSSMSGVDPTLNMLTAFAPTMVGLSEAGYRNGVEGVKGRMTFGDLKIDNNFESAITTVGPGLFRLGHYGYNSNTAAIPNLGLPPGVLTHTRGDAIELAYAQTIHNTTIGLSVVPQDSTSIQAVGGGTTLIAGEAKTDFGGRIGFIQRLPHGVRVGADYSYQKGTATADTLPPFPPTTSSDEYITRAATYGASWQARPDTIVYGSYQNLLATGHTFGSRNANQLWFGTQHDLSKSVAIRLNYLDGGQNYSVQWKTKVGLLNVAYTHKALRNAEEILGSGDALFGALALAW